MHNPRIIVDSHFSHNNLLHQMKDQLSNKFYFCIARDKASGNFTNTRQVLDEIGYSDVSHEDCKNVHYICHLVGKRAAYLASAGNKIKHLFIRIKQ